MLIFSQALLRPDDNTASPSSDLYSRNICQLMHRKYFRQPGRSLIPPAHPLYSTLKRSRHAIRPQRTATELDENSTPRALPFVVASKCATQRSRSISIQRPPHSLPAPHGRLYYQPNDQGQQHQRTGRHLALQLAILHLSRTIATGLHNLNGIGQALHAPLLTCHVEHMR